MKVSHSPMGWLATWPASIGLAPCQPWGFQLPPPVMRPGRGVMAVGNLPLIPSPFCRSVYYKGLKSVNILMMTQESAMCCNGCASKAGRVFDCILSYLICLWRPFNAVVLKALLLSRPPLSTQTGVVSFTKSGTPCFQLEVAVKVVFVWSMLAPGRPGLWKPALLAENKSRQLYLHQKAEHVSYKVLPSDQRLQVQTESNWYCCCKWYSMLFASWHSTLDLLSFTRLSKHTADAPARRQLALSSPTAGTRSENTAALINSRWCAQRCYSYVWKNKPWSQFRSIIIRHQNTQQFILLWSRTKSTETEIYYHLCLLCSNNATHPVDYTKAKGE